MPKRVAQEKTFRTHDGVELFYRYWPAAEKPRGAILLFHRGHEHSGRMAHLADELDLPDFALFAWDARGQGRSPGERGYSPSLADSVRDIQTFTTHIAEVHGIPLERTAVIAQSVGAVLASTWVHDYAPPIRALVLASPAFKVKLYVPFARPGLKLMQRLRGKFFVNSYVKARFLTHDPQRIASYDTDPLITRPIAVNILLDLYETAERIVADADSRVAAHVLLRALLDAPFDRTGLAPATREGTLDGLRWRVVTVPLPAASSGPERPAWSAYRVAARVGWGRAQQISAETIRLGQAK